jgi:hypothetical protein
MGNNPALAFINTPKEAKLIRKQRNIVQCKQRNKITAKINIDSCVKSKYLIRMSTYVPKELKQTLSIIATREGRRVYEIINEALRKYTKDKNV